MRLPKEKSSIRTQMDMSAGLPHFYSSYARRDFLAWPK